jgi:hypothetical protein
MGKDRLGKDEVEFLFELTQGEMLIVEEGRLLDPLDRIAHLVFDSPSDEPLQWFHTEVLPRTQVSDEQPAPSERSTPNVKQRMVVAQPQRGQKIELDSTV